MNGSLLLGTLGRLAVHQVVETSASLHEVVETTHDGEDTEGVDPDTDNTSDVGAVVRAAEPTEDGEEGSQDIDDEDGTSELPRGDGGPERTVGTGDEDQPVLSKGDLKEDNLIDITIVLSDTTIVVTSGEHGGEGNPGTDGKDETEENGHSPELRKVPLDGGLGVRSVIVGNGQGSNIGEDSNEDDEVQVQAVVQDGNPETEEDFHVEGQSDTVDNVGVHAVENLAGSLEGINDSTETGGKEDNIGSGTGSIGRTFDSNTGISLLQRGSIVDTVTSHGNEVTTLLENLNDGVLVLGENFSETIGSLNEIVNLRTGHVTTTTKTETLSVVDVGTKTELAGSLTGNTDGVTSQHLDGETETLGFVDSAGSVVTRGVRAGHDTENLPSTLTTLAGNTERTETTGGKLSNAVLVGLINVLGDGVVLLDSLENEERGTLDADDALTLGRLNNSLDLLGDGVEGVELENLVLGEDGLGTGVELEGLEESLVDGIDTLLLAGSGQAGSEHQVIGLNTLDGERLRERQLVLGESTGLVGAENLNTSKGLNGGELLDDGLLLGEVGSTDSHGGGNDSGKTDRDTDDGNTEGELQNADNLIGAVEGRNPDDKESGDDEDQENGTNAVKNLSEVTSATSGSGNESSSTADEGVVTSGSDDDEGLTTLDSGGREALITVVLVDSERFTSKSGLIDLEEGTLGDDATVSGNDGTIINLEDITGNDLVGLNLLQGTITEDSGLESESLLEFIDDRTGLVFLKEPDTGVKEQETANNTEINPIFETGSENSSSLDETARVSQLKGTETNTGDQDRRQIAIGRALSDRQAGYGKKQWGDCHHDGCIETRSTARHFGQWDEISCSPTRPGRKLVWRM
ncbi:unnamed protein product [Clonostachys rosea]|uniref:Uncharacterized protein n=1 Tax=Bionectria ochroleuca TaxID=29856 RepID=A0ABY6UYS3_BIOOC|nr:unnamed protein product [Clonostachys rosea]